MEWQPIETAPIDKDILIVCNNFNDRSKGVHFAVVRWSKDFCAFYDANIESNYDEPNYDEMISYEFATHWMPLPSPPKGE